MKQYNSLSELLMDRDNFPSSGRLFIEKTTLCDIQNARYWLLSRKELKAADCIEDGHPRIPVSLRGGNAQPFMGIATFAYIIDLKTGNNAGLKAGETGVFVEAITYYLNTSRFMD